MPALSPSPSESRPDLSVLDTVREPVLVLDVGRRVVFANRAFYRAFHVDAAETEGRTVEALGNGQWRIPALLGLLDEVIPGDAAFEDFEVTHAFDHLGPRTMLLNARKVRWPGAGGQLVLLAIEDVTERRRTEAALARRNQELEEFAYTVSHDLKSPLVTITGRIGLLKRHLAAGDAGKVADAVARIERSAERMGHIIEDLLQLSRAGRVTGDLAPVDVGALVERLWEGIAPRLGGRACTLHVAPDLPPVLADEHRLVDVFENLLANAVAYGCTNGATGIRVAWRAAPGELRYAVADDGPGIDPAHHDRIFGLFQRLSTDHAGTGVGLALVAKIMEAHGGRAWVESQPGAGATFWLAFPASARVPSPL